MRAARLLRDVSDELKDAGLRASIVIRDIDTNDQLALDGDVPMPAASLAKLPLALAVLHEIHEGRLDGATVVRVHPGVARSPGIGSFRHPAAVAISDLVSLSLRISDDAAADALLEVVTPETVMAYLEQAGLRRIVVRRPFSELWDTPLEHFQPDDAHLAHTLAIRGSTPAHGHPVRQLDVGRANTGCAMAWADLLQAVWLERGVHPVVANEIRDHLHNNVHRQRLSPDFLADDTRWSSKTGTILNLRHEAGVVEHQDGSRLAVVVLSTSEVPASHQPAADAALGAAARCLHDALRATT